MKYIFFYALPDDIVPALRDFEVDTPLKFIETDILPSPNRGIYLCSSEIPHPGIAQKPSGNICSTYMVSHRDIKNHLHSVRAKDGRTLWSLRNGDNEETVLLDLGGLSKTNCVLEGQMSTLHTTQIAQQLMRKFRSSLKKQKFVRMQRCWVGPSAFALLKAGKRLTQAEQSPPEFDLKLSSTSASLISDVDSDLFG